jgi:hypothetical protein
MRKYGRLFMTETGLVDPFTLETRFSEGQYEAVFEKSRKLCRYLDLSSLDPFAVIGLERLIVCGELPPDFAAFNARPSGAKERQQGSLLFSKALATLAQREPDGHSVLHVWARQMSPQQGHQAAKPIDLELVIFVEQTPGRWEVRRLAWNKEQKDHRFDSVDPMRMAYKSARSRVLATD